jgi:hypothetical protein
MSVLKTCALAAAAVLVAGSTYAAPAQAAQSTKTATTKQAAAKATTAPKPKAHSVVGTLDKYDSGANSIVVNTGKGTETLSLSSTSAVRMGAKTMAAADLSSHTGDRVKVRYSELNGQRTVQSVQIQGKPAAKQVAASSKPAAKK